MRSIPKTLIRISFVSTTACRSINPVGSRLIRLPPSNSFRPGQRRFVHPPVQTLLMLVLHDAEPTLLCPNATLLDPAEWRRDRKLLVGVDPHRACLEGTRHTPRALVIAGPNS